MKPLWLGYLAGLSLLVTGCVSHRMKPATHPEYMVAIDSEGYLRGTNGHRIDRQKRKLYDDYLDIIFKSPDLEQRTNILLFIQGGLNGLDNAVDRADCLGKLILNDTNRPAYPIFIGWDANLFSSWFEHYYQVHRGETDQRTALLLFPFTLISDTARLASRAPLSMIEQAGAGRRTFQSTQYGQAPHGTNDHRAVLFREVSKQYATLRAGKMDVLLAESQDTNAFRWRGATMLAKAPPKIVWTAAVDSAGKVGWDHMLRRTKTMFTMANYFQEGGMEIFARRLADHLASHTNVTLTVVAHSMGSIVANELIRRHGNQLRISEIVYMAAACGVEDFDRFVVPFLRSHTNVHFFNLCLHPANDSGESYGYISPALEPFAPQGSLLEWIDDYYSSTETDYGRTLGKWDNAILGTKGYLEKNDPLQHRIHIKGFGVGSEETHGPQHHGGFDQMRFWDTDFWRPGVWDERLLHRWKAGKDCLP